MSSSTFLKYKYSVRLIVMAINVTSKLILKSIVWYIQLIVLTSVCRRLIYADSTQIPRLVVKNSYTDWDWEANNISNMLCCYGLNKVSKVYFLRISKHYSFIYRYFRFYKIIIVKTFNKWVFHIYFFVQGGVTGNNSSINHTPKLQFI